ncbi:EF-hand domain-containing protein [Luteolibacter luteus]|uniref:EF-hand domain-containing protein n=1 Tax=Luteolibacter luteus TaxID=2728835 RepID=A0A858RD66_9BACT|nr:EF-hand domain-containing protein [Luteolibacter luteus]QJE94260.1 hypothetical protein HHL09_00155 [Luteolibacter luteus]
MKLRLLLPFLLCGVCGAVPPSATTGVPAFLDTDNDGKISEAERQAYAEARKAARENNGNANGKGSNNGNGNNGNNGNGQGNSKWDTNGDGVVDDDERNAAVQTLKSNLENKIANLFLDLAGDDELLSLEEFATLPQFKNTPPQKAANLFNMMDADDDGLVTLTEFFRGIGRGKGPDKPKSSGGS